MGHKLGLKVCEQTDLWCNTSESNKLSISNKNHLISYNYSSHLIPIGGLHCSKKVKSLKITSPKWYSLEILIYYRTHFSVLKSFCGND